MAIAVFVKFENSDSALFAFNNAVTTGEIIGRIEDEENGKIGDYQVAFTPDVSDAQRADVFAALKAAFDKSWE